MTIKTRIYFLSILLVLLVGGGIFFYGTFTGKLNIFAEADISCQSAKKISSFFGRPGSNLTTLNFFGTDLPIHELMAPSLDNVQKEIKAKKIDYDFVDVQSFSIRSKRGSPGQSLHSWGIAVDVNPGRNPQGGSTTDIPSEVVDIFKKNGFYWGGNWTGKSYDPMHFEWYGASLSGEIVDNKSSQKILLVSTAINNAGSPNANGDYYWVVPYGEHQISAQSRGYEGNSFPITLGCFTQDEMNIGLEPLPDNIPGTVAGTITLSGNNPLLVPANIFLDDKLVGVTNLSGDYMIPSIKAGKHKIEAKILFFPGSSKVVEIVPGDRQQFVDIKIGK